MEPVWEASPLRFCFTLPPRYPRSAADMKLSPHDLQQHDQDAVRRLPEAALRHLSLTLLANLKEARERLAQNPRNSSRPPSSRAPWEYDPPADQPALVDTAPEAPAPPPADPPAGPPTTPHRRRPPARRETRVTARPRSAGRASRWGPPGSDGPRSSRPIPPQTTAPRSVPAAVSP